MTEKKVADKIREIANAPTLSIEGRRELTRLANELDPPRPEPGTVVWWRGSVVDTWHLGCAVVYGIVPADNINACWNWDCRGLEWKPARIAGPMQETATIPPLDQWPEDSEYCEVAIVFDGHTNSRRVQHAIDRKEAERREAEG